MVKELTFEDEARTKLLSGASKLAQAVRTTLGPRGRSAVIDRSWGGPRVSKDGATVAEEVELKDRVENIGARMIREASPCAGLRILGPSRLQPATHLAGY